MTFVQFTALIRRPFMGFSAMLAGPGVCASTLFFAQLLTLKAPAWRLGGVIGLMVYLRTLTGSSEEKKSSISP